MALYYEGARGFRKVPSVVEYLFERVLAAMIVGMGFGVVLGVVWVKAQGG